MLTKSIDRIAAQAAAIDKGALEELVRALLLCFFVRQLIRLIWNNCSAAIMLLLHRQILLIFMNPRMQIIFLFSQKVSLIVKTHITKVEKMVKQLGDLCLQQPRLLLCPRFFPIYLLPIMLYMPHGIVLLMLIRIWLHCLLDQ
jgi:hypothetical protein